jgi:hypothetical protein
MKSTVDKTPGMTRVAPALKIHQKQLLREENIQENPAADITVVLSDTSK